MANYNDLEEFMASGPPKANSYAEKAERLWNAGLAIRNLPFDAKDIAKAEGALFHPVKRVWVAPDEPTRERLQKIADSKGRDRGAFSSEALLSVLTSRGYYVATGEQWMKANAAGIFKSPAVLTREETKARAEAERQEAAGRQAEMVAVVKADREASEKSLRDAAEKAIAKVEKLNESVDVFEVPSQ